MLLEVLQFYKPGLQLHALEYRAHNPVIVNRTSTIYGALTSENKADLSR
jgi:hydroxyacyl-ACP dehydratase HTD2-like protein with hotdog domain